jgi:hypothetical protein
MGADPFLLEARPSFALAALLVAAIGSVATAVAVISLRLSVRHLERMSLAARTGSYGRFIGASVDEIFAGAQESLPFRPQLLLLVSSQCRTCETLLQQVTAADWTLPTAVAWVDRPPQGVRDARSPLVLLKDGRRLGERLNVRVMPFALVFDHDGAVVHASPVTTVRALAERAGIGRFQPV